MFYTTFRNFVVPIQVYCTSHKIAKCRNISIIRTAHTTRRLSISKSTEAGFKSNPSVSNSIQVPLHRRNANCRIGQCMFQHFRRQIETNRRDILHHSARDPSYLRGALVNMKSAWNCGTYRDMSILLGAGTAPALRDSISKLCTLGQEFIQIQLLQTAVKMTSMKR